MKPKPSLESNSPNANVLSEANDQAHFSQPAYELLDFGDSRKLERFAGFVLDRPCPAAKGSRRRRISDWKDPERQFRDAPESGWSSNESPQGWLFRWQTLAMELRLSPFGHVGLFPEQIANWRWLQSLITHSDSPREPSALAAGSSVSQATNATRTEEPAANADPLTHSKLMALNLFGYTGGSTLALASAGCQVTHVDASKPTVQWARRNATLSGLDAAPIRWIVDDVRDFVKREVKRGAHYDIVLMDPPAYGHGADGKSWALERDLENLIDDCLVLMKPNPTALLLTGHSPIESLDQGPLTNRTWKELQAAFNRVGKHRVSLLDSHQRKLDFGYAYRLWN
ncbi:MAG: class I SAM-dependent methyltransferase [Pirellulaceae bacterium]|nr:class I SAM-dependent methyltransferase [Pirellulaceae bacterium]